MEIQVVILSLQLAALVGIGGGVYLLGEIRAIVRDQDRRITKLEKLIAAN